MITKSAPIDGALLVESEAWAVQIDLRKYCGNTAEILRKYCGNTAKIVRSFGPALFVSLLQS